MTASTAQKRATRPVLIGSGRRRSLREQRSAWIFVAPSMIIIVTFILWPIIQSFRFSFYDWKIGAKTQKWLGLGNYVELIRDPLFWNALSVTLLFSLANVIILLVLGYGVAAALQRDSRVNRVLRSLFFFPTIVALSTIGMVWRFLLDPDIGFVSGMMMLLGFESVAFLREPDLALPTVIFVSVWKNVGFTMIILLAALKGVPQHLYEAAKLDGATGLQLTWHVTLPSIRPAILLAAVMLTINSMQVFDLVYVMTGGGPLYRTDTLVTMLHREAFGGSFNLGYASSIALVLFLIIVLISVVQMKVLRYDDAD